MKEIWKDISDYEGYQVSNSGRVKRLAREVVHGRHGKLKIKSRILKQTGSGGGKGHFAVVDLVINGAIKSCRVSKLVGLANQIIVQP